MFVEMYRDTASSFGLCEDNGYDDNSIVIDIPEYILESYYKRQIQHSYEDEDISFTDWINLVYTLDDMEGLLGFIKRTFGNLDCVEV